MIDKIDCRLPCNATNDRIEKSSGSGGFCRLKQKQVLPLKKYSLKAESGLTVHDGRRTDVGQATECQRL